MKELTFEAIALLACEIYAKEKDPVMAWDKARKEKYNGSSTVYKSCPKETFLGLCDKGLVKEIPAGFYGSNNRKQHINRTTAVGLYYFLKANPDLLLKSNQSIWVRFLSGKSKNHDHQVDVVKSLMTADKLI